MKYLVVIVFASIIGTLILIKLSEVKPITQISLNDSISVTSTPLTKPSPSVVVTKGSQKTDAQSELFKNFKVGDVLEEASSMYNSKNKYWWLSSGGQLYWENDALTTIWGETSENDKWRRLYADSNPIDTDNGLHPQNIFRLVSKSSFLNYSQQVYFWVESINLSISPQRNESNGILLFNRYQDENNLYYTGIRVDGNLVLKKKIKGQYITLAIKKIYNGDYHLNNNPNLIPRKKWIGLKSEIKNVDNGVNIAIYLDLNNSSSWKKYIDFTDYGQNDNPILHSGSVGIRTDFMDVQFKDFKVLEL